MKFARRSVAIPRSEMPIERVIFGLNCQERSTPAKTVPYFKEPSEHLKNLPSRLIRSISIGLFLSNLYARISVIYIFSLLAASKNGVDQPIDGNKFAH
jgi:hypothetical protein